MPSRMLSKAKLYLVTLPRLFALPYLGAASMLGSYLAGGSVKNLDSWLGFLVVAFLMAGGHVVNTYLDYYWTGLDRGEETIRSSEKFYCGGQNLIERGLVSRRGLVMNAVFWYAGAGVIAGFLIADSTWWICPLGFAGIIVAFWYSWGKFNYTHELSLGVGCGPVPVLIGMYAVNSHPDVQTGLLVSVPFAIILSFGGLALDEWPDAEANLLKGVRSMAYEVYRCGMNLPTYLLGWFIALYVYQVWLMNSGYLAQWTAITFVLFPPMMASMVFLNKACLNSFHFFEDVPADATRIVCGVKLDDLDYFSKVAAWVVVIGALYPILLVVGQALD